MFLNLQHRNATKNNLLKLVTNDGGTHDSPNYILKEEAKYFKHLFPFQSPPSPLTEANCMDFCSINTVKLTYVQKDSREGQIIQRSVRVFLLLFI
jgi:hypothetical protein